VYDYTANRLLKLAPGTVPGSAQLGSRQAVEDGRSEKI